MAAEKGLVDRLSPGHVDDGSDTGVVLVKSLGSRLMRIPIKPGEEVLTVATAGTAGITNAVQNPDGTGIGISLACPQVSGATTSSASVERTIWGPRVGVRLTRGTSQSPFTLIVDGCPYRVDGVRNRRASATTLGVDDNEAMFLVADDLHSGPHNVVASLVGQPANGDGSSRNVGLLGWIGDANFYEPRPRAAVSSGTPVAVPTTAGTIPVVSPMGLVQGITFYNPTSAAIQATLTKGGVAYWSRSVPAGSDVSVEFGLPIQSVASVQAERYVASTTGLVARIFEAQ